MNPKVLIFVCLVVIIVLPVSVFLLKSHRSVEQLKEVRQLDSRTDREISAYYAADAVGGILSMDGSDYETSATSSEDVDTDIIEDAPTVPTTTLMAATREHGDHPAGKPARFRLNANRIYRIRSLSTTIDVCAVDFKTIRISSERLFENFTVVGYAKRSWSDDDDKMFIARINVAVENGVGVDRPPYLGNVRVNDTVVTHDRHKPVPVTTIYIKQTLDANNVRSYAIVCEYKKIKLRKPNVTDTLSCIRLYRLTDVPVFVRCWV